MRRDSHRPLRLKGLPRMPVGGRLDEKSCRIIGCMLLNSCPPEHWSRGWHEVSSPPLRVLQGKAVLRFLLLLPPKCFLTTISEKICTLFYSELYPEHMWPGNRSRGGLGSGEEFAHWPEWVSGELWLQGERSEVQTLCWTLPAATLGGMARGGRGQPKRACLVPRAGEPSGFVATEG